MKRIVLSFLAIFLLATCAFAESQYIASRNKEPFHVTSCKWAGKISPSNAVYYDTREESINAGHRPCKVCNPYCKVTHTIKEQQTKSVLLKPYK
jgi:micrococcal nuclease